MLRLVTILSLLLAAPLYLPHAGANQMVEVKDARFPRAIEEEGTRYRLIGHGLFRYMIWDAYAGAYYQAEDAPTPAPQSDVPRRLVLHYFHTIEAEEFAEATRETVRDSLDAEEYSAIVSGLQDFNAHYRDVEPGDRYALTWDGDSLTLALNDERLYQGEDPALAAALFGIWLGEEPLGEGFRDALLGR
jgi:hypothetical protein